MSGGVIQNQHGERPLREHWITLTLKQLTASQRSARNREESCLDSPKPPW